MCELQRSEDYWLGVLDASLAMMDVLTLTVKRKDLEDMLGDLISEVNAQRSAAFMKENLDRRLKALR